MMFISKKIGNIVSITTFLCFSIISCKNDYDRIGLDIQSDLINATYIDSCSIVGCAFENDSMNTGSTLGVNILGYLNDPTFGKTQADFYTQFILSSSNVEFINWNEIDSAVISLSISGYYGDTSSKMHVRVYELTEALSTSASYYATSTVAHSNTNITRDADAQITVRPNTPVSIDTNTYGAQLRIPLDISYIKSKFFNQSGQSVLANNTNFLNYCKGFYITTEDPNNAGCAIYTNLTSDESCMTLYYKNTEGKSLTYTLKITSDCARFNRFDHFNYTGATANLISQIRNNNTSTGNEVLYLQAGDGIASKITFPYIKETFKNKKVIINKAELILYNISTDANYFYPPITLGIQKNTANGTLTYIPDNGTASYDVSTKTYCFTLTQYIQSLINSTETDYGINIVVSGYATRLNRLVFAGFNPVTNPDKRIMLKIYYSEY